MKSKSVKVGELTAGSVNETNPYGIISLCLRQLIYLGYKPRLEESITPATITLIAKGWENTHPIKTSPVSLLYSIQEVAELPHAGFPAVAITFLVTSLERALCPAHSKTDNKVKRDMELAATAVAEFMREYRRVWRFIYDTNGIPKKNVCHIQIKYNSNSDELVPLKEFLNADHFVGSPMALWNAKQQVNKGKLLKKEADDLGVLFSFPSGGEVKTSAFDAHGKQTSKDPEGLVSKPKLHFHVICDKKALGFIRFLVKNKLPNWRVTTGKAGHFDFSLLSMSAVIPSINYATGKVLRGKVAERVTEERMKYAEISAAYQKARFGKVSAKDTLEAATQILNDMQDACPESRKRQEAKVKKLMVSMRSKSKKPDLSTAGYVACKALPTFQPQGVIKNIRVALGGLADDYLVMSRRKYIKKHKLAKESKCPYWGITESEKRQAISELRASLKGEISEWQRKMTKEMLKAYEDPQKHYANFIGTTNEELAKKREESALKAEKRKAARANTNSRTKPRKVAL